MTYVGLNVVSIFKIQSRPAVSIMDQLRLCISARQGETFRVTVLVGPSTTNDRSNGIAICDCVIYPLKYNSGKALATPISISRLIETFALPVPCQELLI